jgi:hypothetical protein
MTDNNNTARVSVKVPCPDRSVEVRVIPPDCHLEVKVTSEGDALVVKVTPRGRQVEVKISPTSEDDSDNWKNSSKEPNQSSDQLKQSHSLASVSSVDNSFKEKGDLSSSGSSTTAVDSSFIIDENQDFSFDLSLLESGISRPLENDNENKSGHAPGDSLDLESPSELNQLIAKASEEKNSLAPKTFKSQPETPPLGELLESSYAIDPVSSDKTTRFFDRREDLPLEAQASLAQLPETEHLPGPVFVDPKADTDRLAGPYLPLSSLE